MNDCKMKIIWNKIRFNADCVVKQSLITISVVIAALTFSGDWLVIFTNARSRHDQTNSSIQNSRNFNPDNVVVFEYFREFRQFWISAMLIGYLSYFSFGFGLHYLYFVAQKDDPLKWKCQPNRWLSRELEIDEIKTGSITLLIVNTWSALFAYYLYSGCYTTLYSPWNKYGIIWWLLQFAVLFLYTEYLTYWCHRFFHIPYFYKQFHYVHHKYKQPTAFSTVAFHPVELTIFQTIFLIPSFVIPIHWVPFHLIILNGYYHGILSHSGINFKSKWWQPWQPHTVFHDNHHQYCHVNYGFNCFWWDKLHGTYRKVDRIYNPTIFSGKGKSIYELDELELKKEMDERQTESRTGYDNDYNPYIDELEELKLTWSPLQPARNSRIESNSN